MSDYAIRADGLSKRFRIPLDHPPSLLYKLAHPVSTSRYRELKALNNVSFSLKRGEFLGITGANGCGKTTLLKLLSRIYEPDAGRIRINGRIAPFIELGVGFKDELTARENIFLAGALHGLTAEQLEPRVDDVLEFAELTGFADQKLKNFSSGMVVRLAFTVAMLADADILLMDEVLAVGDAHFQEKCFDVFAHYKRLNRSVVLVTHDLAALETHCDRVLLMRDGETISDGPARAVISEYRRMVASMTDDSVFSEAQQSPASRFRGEGKDAEIVEVVLVDKYGKRRQSLLTGDPISVVVRYRARRPADRLAVKLVFSLADGGLVVHSTSTDEQPTMGSAATGAIGVATYDVPALPLLSGTYSVGAALVGHRGTDHPLDIWDDAVVFRVTDDAGRTGLVDFRGSWGKAREHEEPASRLASA